MITGQSYSNTQVLWQWAYSNGYTDIAFPCINIDTILENALIGGFIVDHDDFKKEFLFKISNDYDDIAVYKTLIKYKNQGMDKTTMYNLLDSLRLEMRNKGDEKTEDAIMEFMDLVVGYCDPQWKIFQ